MVSGEGTSLPEWRLYARCARLHGAWTADDRVDDLSQASAIGMISANLLNIGHLAPPVSCRHARYTQWITKTVRDGKRGLKNAVNATHLEESNFLLAVRISNLVEIFICCSQEGRSNARMAVL